MVQYSGGKYQDFDKWLLNPLTPISDQDRISSYNIDTVSTKQVMRKKKNIDLEILSWSHTKFSELTLQDLYVRQLGELLMWSGSERVNKEDKVTA